MDADQHQHMITDALRRGGNDEFRARNLTQTALELRQDCVCRGFCGLAAWVGLASVLFVSLCSPTLAQTEIPVDVTYEAYEVGGDTLPDIQAAMNAQGPYGFPAYTTWYVNWTAECEVTVTASITLPDLGPDADLSPQDEATFRTMLENLEDHEYNHVEFGIAYAEEVKAMGCRGDTASLLQEYLAEERQYDADTEHGRTEGAWLETD